MAWYRIVQFALLALGIGIGASRFRLLSKSGRWYWVLLLVTFITELVSWQVGKLYGNNVVVSWIFLPVQFILIVGGYLQELSSYKLALWLSAGVVISVSLASAIMQRQVLMDEYPAFVKAVCNVLIVIWSLIYLRRLLNLPTLYSFTEYPLFWCSIGWLLYTIITYFGFSAFNYIYSQNEAFIALFLYLRILANFSLYVLIDIALFRKQRTLSMIANG